MGIHVAQRVCAGLSEACTPHQTPVLPPLIVSLVLQIELRVGVEGFSKAMQPESGGQRALGMLAPLSHTILATRSHHPYKCLGDSQHQELKAETERSNNLP